jgi:2-polyprenyl-3-methyl-5-hydroxy-6-metoxy-1,4-benzoquinol methylase
MKSEDLGLPVFYQEYPEYFDSPDDRYSSIEKNQAVEALVKRYDAKKILDLTCGTGSQVIYLASRGYHVIGADFSPKLVKIACEKSKKQNLDVDFLDGDMRSLYIGEFDAVITIDNAIGHLVKDDFEIALQNIHSNLRSGGIYIFDILNIDALTDEVLAEDCKKMTDIQTMKDGTEIQNIRSFSIDYQNGLINSTNQLTFTRNGQKEEIKNQSSLQIYGMNELRHVLEKNNFQVVEQFKIDAFTFKRDDKGYSIMTVAQKV